MTYQSITEMAYSNSLAARITAAAAQEGVTQYPEQWVQTRIWQIVSADPQWEARWSDATFNYNLMFNQDTGARPDVITDDLITDVIQVLVAAPPE